MVKILAFKKKGESFSQYIQDRIMVVIIFTIIIFILYMLYCSIFRYAHRWGNIEGDIIFTGQRGNTSLFYDSLYVFIIRPEFGTTLDSLERFYQQKVTPMEDTVAYLKRQEEIYIRQTREQELLFRVTAREQMKLTQLYESSKKYFDYIKAQEDSVKKLYDAKRNQLINQQSGYNKVIAQLINEKVYLKSEVDKNGHFKFRKLENGNYYIYALRIISGGKDVTHIPSYEYYLLALSKQDIKKYSWMFKMSVKENTYIRLDSTNMSYVFK